LEPLNKLTYIISSGVDDKSFRATWTHDYRGLAVWTLLMIACPEMFGLF
jgi:hypothetical protein